jgi:sugar/nucleoside kinase (ribokinase family)
MDATIVGIISIDSITVADAPTKACLGGAALNLAVGFKVAGGNPSIVSVVGTDLTEESLACLSSYFEMSNIRQLAGRTCRFELHYDDIESSPNIRSFPGVATCLASHVLASHCTTSRLHICCTWPLAAAEVFDHLARQGAKKTTASFILGSLKEQLAQLMPFLDSIEYIFIDEAEFALLEEMVCLSQIAPTLIVTTGSQGSRAIRSGQVIHEQPAVPSAKLRDSTGAGDVYAGSFLASIERGLPISEAMRQASLVSAKTLRQFGVLHLLGDTDHE